MYTIIAGVMNKMFDTDNVNAAAAALLEADPLSRGIVPGETLVIEADILEMTATVRIAGGDAVPVTPLTAKAIASCARTRKPGNALHQIRNIVATVPAAQASATLRAAEAADPGRKPREAAGRAAAHLRRYGWKALARQVEAQARRG
ncbi:MAG: hypothetical protein J0I42_09770 [Bosea sp.]|uniref:hypothetical protein n=1 Tax=Bosea sp. (in: a-proteobacteria) TaxID=1871050 RepID=UPI001AD4864A|nr:hypothetical protein [Bosea sp. (in: a-proteobacteria)]MBN9452226.1 hypothetical protein [Bosea sp. (in: a-proteobacteria)]